MACLEYAPLGAGWIPERALNADQVVVLLIDGLGWNQLVERQHLAPVLSAGEGQPITSVVPSTTSAALTSFTTGVAPGEHGLVGYRIRVGAETLNTLRWTTENGDARERIRPADFVKVVPFNNRAPVVVTRAEFATSGFTNAHLMGTDFRGYGATSTLVWEIERALAEGQRFVYAYYDGLDRVGHERGHGGAFDAEFRFVDRLVGDVIESLPEGAVLLVTADHGQVHTGDALVDLAPEVRSHLQATSGEARLMWLHARPGHEADLYAAAAEAHSDVAWVVTRDDVISQRWLGPVVSPHAEFLLGDVALAARGNWAFVEPDRPTPSLRLLGRHGSLTVDEMMVPLLCW